MSGPNLYASGLAVGGCLMLMIGIGHLFLPTWGYDPALVASLGAPLADHFYYLATYALCAFFLTQGGLSLWLAWRPPSRTGLAVATALAIWWWGRLYLEGRYPVVVALFGIERPTSLLTVVIGLAALAYSATVGAGVRLWRQGVAL